MSDLISNLKPPSKEEEGDYEAQEQAEEAAADRDALMAAIDKLTAERDKAQYHEVNGWLAEVNEGASGAIDDPGYSGVTNDPIMVILYRTIDFQIAFLHSTLSDGMTVFGGGTCFDPRGLDLARAINGVTS